WIAYVYLGCLLILFFLRVVISKMVDFVGWSNLFGLRNTIARERGIAAYRAWVPFERIRPASIPQKRWEEAFAWPANNQPPYAPLAERILRGAISYVVLGLIAAVLLQVFTPFPVLTWLGELAKMLVRCLNACHQLHLASSLPECPRIFVQLASTASLSYFGAPASLCRPPATEKISGRGCKA